MPLAFEQEAGELHEPCVAAREHDATAAVVSTEDAGNDGRGADVGRVRRPRHPVADGEPASCTFSGGELDHLTCSAARRRPERAQVLRDPEDDEIVDRGRRRRSGSA